MGLRGPGLLLFSYLSSPKIRTAGEKLSISSVSSVSLRFLFNECWVKGLIWWQDLTCCFFFMSYFSASVPSRLTGAGTSSCHHEEAIVWDHDFQDAVTFDTFALGLWGGCTSRWEHVEGNHLFCSQGTKGIRGRDLGSTILFKAPVT